MAGLQFGITYDGNDPDAYQDGKGIDVFSWVLCATLEFNSTGVPWPRPGSGNLVTWSQSSCQAGPLTVAGYFYAAAYSSDTFRVIPRPIDGSAKVARCGEALG